VDSTNSETGEQDVIVVDNIIGVGSQCKMAPSLGIDAVFDHVIVDAGNHATNGEAVLTRARVGLDGVADHLPLG
jgi:hypothetical protein